MDARSRLSRNDLSTIRAGPSICWRKPRGSLQRARVEFATIPFAYFFLLSLTGTWLLRDRRVARNSFLLVASYYFAWRFHDHFLVVLVVSTVVNYQVARVISRTTGRARTAWLAFGIAFDISVLAYFKYWNFFATAANSFAEWLGLGSHLQLIEYVAP